MNNPQRKTILLTAAIAIVAGGLALALSQSDQVKALIDNKTTTTAQTETPTTDDVATTAANTAATTETAIETVQDAAQATQETAANEEANMTPVDLNTQTPAAGDDKAEVKSDFKVDVAKAMEDRSIGSKDAPITVYDYSSLTCPHCAMFHTEILPRIKTEYIDTGKVRWVFKGFPLNEPALKAEMLARCAPDDQYIKLTDMMYKEQARWAFSDAPMPTLAIMVRIAGISQEIFDACTTNSELETAMVQKTEEASKKHNIGSTPTFVLNDGEKTISGAGSYTGFAYDLDEMLKQDPSKKATTENKDDFMPPAAEEDPSKKAEDTFTNKK